MKFGKSWEEAKDEPTGGAGGKFISYPREGTTRIRILDEPEQWEAWWEHYDKALSKSYPCTNDRDTCPGCQSESAKTRSASRKVGFNVVMTKDDKQYVNYFKVTRRVAERLSMRAAKYKTIRDRDYSLTRIGSGTDTDYDVEAEEKEVLDLTEFDEQRKDCQTLLAEAFNDAFGPDATNRLDKGKVIDPSSGKAKPKTSWADDPDSAPDFAKPKQDSSADADEADEPENKDEEIARLKAQLASRSGSSKAESETATSGESTGGGGSSESKGKKKKSKKKVKAEAPEGSKRAQTGDPDDPPSESEGEQDTQPEEEGVKGDAEVDPGEPELTEADLKSMTKGALVSLIVTEQKWGRLPTEHVSNKTKVQLIEWLKDHSS